MLVDGEQEHKLSQATKVDTNIGQPRLEKLRPILLF
jgi:hypothetical protein